MSEAPGAGVMPSPTSEDGAGAMPSQPQGAPAPDPVTRAGVMPSEGTPQDSGDRRDADSGESHDDEGRRDADLSSEEIQKALKQSRAAERAAQRELKRYQDEEAARINANKSELERVTEERDRLLAENRSMTRERLAKEVASEAGIPQWWDVLDGDDVRALRASAQRMRERLGIGSGTLDGGVRGIGSPAPSTMDDLIRGGMRR